MIPELQIDHHLTEIDNDDMQTAVKQNVPSDDRVDVVQLVDQIYQLQHAAIYWEARYTELKRAYDTLQRKNTLLQLDIAPEF